MGMLLDSGSSPRPNHSASMQNYKTKNQGPFEDGSNTVLAVTGGTGSFRGVYGEMQLVHMSNPNKFTFVYSLSYPN